MTRIFCEQGIERAVNILVDALVETLGETGEIERDAIRDAVEGVFPDIVRRGEEAAENYAGDVSHEECYSWDTVQEEVQDAIRRLDAEDLPADLYDEIKEEGRSESLAPCPDCGSGRLEFQAVLGAWKCDRCWTVQALRARTSSPSEREKESR